MKFFPKIIFLLMCFSLMSAFQSSKKKVIFFGDSITEAGVHPGGYITLMNDLTGSSSNQYELKGAGIGGNKVYDLYLRMDQDVIAHHPDIVVIYVGVNDVWHKQSFGTGTDPDKFEKFYVALVKKLQDQKIKVAICTPAVVGEHTDFSNELDGDLNRYSNIIRKIAQENR